MKIVAFDIYRQIGPNLDHIFGPSSGTLGPIPKKILRDNLPNMAGIGPIFSLLGPKMWEELRCKGIKWLLLYKGRDLIEFLLTFKIFDCNMKILSTFRAFLTF